jgi:hypothetical protein
MPLFFPIPNWPSIAGLLVCSLNLASPLAFAQSFTKPLPRHSVHDQGRPIPNQSRPQSPPIHRPSQAAPYALRFDGRYAEVPITFPRPILHAVYAANTLQRKPYRMGGGHSRLYDSAYDCSGSISYILFHSGLLRSPLSSKEFANYGLPGPGRFITIYVKPGDHVFLTICGLRLDTTGGREAEGPRWRPKPRSTAGFISRHPPGL